MVSPATEISSKYIFRVLESSPATEVPPAHLRVLEISPATEVPSASLGFWNLLPLKKFRALFRVLEFAPATKIPWQANQTARDTATGKTNLCFAGTGEKG